jgi:hypothetical protein
MIYILEQLENTPDVLYTGSMQHAPAHTQKKELFIRFTIHNIVMSFKLLYMLFFIITLEIASEIQKEFTYLLI